MQGGVKGGDKVNGFGGHIKIVQVRPFRKNNYASDTPRCHSEGQLFLPRRIQFAGAHRILRSILPAQNDISRYS